MAMQGIGDLSRSLMLRHQLAALKDRAMVAAQEATTGQTADRLRHRGGDLGPLLGISSSLTRLGAFTRAAEDAALLASRMQTALATVEGQTAGLADGLLTIGLVGEKQTLAALGQDAEQRLDAVIATLNQQTGGVAPFAGIAGSGAALAPSGAILGALETAITTSGATGAGAVAVVIADWFEDPAGFAAQGYLGGPPRSAIPLSPEDSVTLDVTAAEPALRDTIRALAMAALTGRGIPAGLAERSELARLAGEDLLQGATGRTALAARIGLAEGRIGAAISRNAAETATLRLSQTGLLAIDPYEAATRLEETSGQIETLHAVTARLSRLSLVDFLR
ncbi:flagellin [Szabonella alba]|uniref:Flagellar biosynthesis protein FlgL n=1 Tax=Szabonella alba TaxID=2804194 RepID=A0A8K0VCZ9_9RHOB|nr:flagellin [Szabonella alba]MBL4917037.1 flagellar biosynthesis protein FlgL [Szabonella alba]